MSVTSKAFSEIVGLDLGHGETAACRVGVDSTAEPEILEINQLKSQVTALAKDKKGVWHIGELAARLEQPIQLNITFKARPTRDFTQRELLGKYLQTCHQHFVKEKYIIDPDDTVYYIGCPSGWSDDDRKEYGRLLALSEVSGVNVIPESRAAFIQAKESDKMRLTMEQLRGAVLIVDIGSSTTDFTLVQDLKQKPLDFGHNLGAAVIEHEMARRLVDESDDRDAIQQAFTECPPYKARLELECRKLKVDYFRLEEHTFGPTVRFGDVRLETEVDEKTMHEVLHQPLESLGGKSWAWCYRKVLEDARATLAQWDSQPQIILLTGGPSRMRIALTTCEEVFPDAEIRRDTEPEFSIARGLARVGRHELNAQAFLADVHNFCDSDALTSTIRNRIPKLVDLVKTPLAKGVVKNAIRPTLKKWRNGQIKTLERLENRDLRDEVSRWLNSNQANDVVQKAAISWFEEIIPEINSEILRICEQHHIPASVIELTAPDSMRTPIDPKIDVFDPSVVTTVAAVITAVIVANISGGAGMALIASGLIGFIIGAIIGLVMGKAAGQYIADKIKEVEVYPWLRKLVLTDAKIDQLCNESQQHTEKSIASALSPSPVAIVDDARKQIREILIRAADEAVLYIS